MLTFPSGARGQRLQDGQAARLLTATPCWMQLAGVCDVLLADQDTPGLSPGGRPSLEDGLLSAWLGPFAWLLVAEPVDEATLDELTSAVALAQLTAQRADSPRAKLAERRAAARHAELRQAASTGLWRVHLLAGAATPEQAAQVAGLLRASADLEGLPYALLPAQHAAARPERDRERPGRRSMLDEPELQWAVTAERQRTTAMNSYQPTPAPGRHPRTSGGRYRSQPPRFTAQQHWSPCWPGCRHGKCLACGWCCGPRSTSHPKPPWPPKPPSPARDGHAPTQCAWVRCSGWNRVPCGELALPQASLNRHVFVLRGDRRGQVPERPEPAGAGHEGGYPVAGRPTRQSRVPADGRPAARGGGDQHPSR